MFPNSPRNFPKNPDGKYGEDCGFDDYYKMLCKYESEHLKKDGTCAVLGVKEAIDTWESQPFYVSKFLDNFQSLQSTKMAFVEFNRCWGLPWSYDVGEIK